MVKQIHRCVFLQISNALYPRSVKGKNNVAMYSLIVHKILQSCEEKIYIRKLF